MTATDEECRGAISSIIQRIEGYANTGLNYIQHKFEEEKDEFRSPIVFVNLLRDLTKSKKGGMKKWIKSLL